MVQHRAILTMPTNRKSYMVYQTAPFSMTLNDRLPRFQGHDILWRWRIRGVFATMRYRNWHWHWHYKLSIGNSLSTAAGKEEVTAWFWLQRRVK